MVEPLSRWVEPDRVHRDVYLSEPVFQREREMLFARTWNYVAHDSQLPNVGDYLRVAIAAQPLLAIRHTDNSIALLYNRCVHKGAMLVTACSGNSANYLRCPYHGWSYRSDGSLIGMPQKHGYDGTRLLQTQAAQGLSRVANVVVYRGFIFARLSDTGPGFHEYFDAALHALDNLADHSPQGKLQILPQCLRSVMRCNWKIYLENINDAMHPVTLHEAAASAAREVWQQHPQQAARPMAAEQLLPFGSGYELYDRMQATALPNGHSVLGANTSLHSGYANAEDYEHDMTQAYGEQRAKAILAYAPQNSVLFPSLSVKSSPPAIRVIRPLAVDRTLIEAWAFQPLGAPSMLAQRALSYNRLVFSPMSVVGQDDAHVFEAIQTSLRAEGNEWVSLQRNFAPGEYDEAYKQSNGTSELLMRNQYRAWCEFMRVDD